VTLLPEDREAKRARRRRERLAPRGVVLTLLVMIPIPIALAAFLAGHTAIAVVAVAACGAGALAAARPSAALPILEHSWSTCVDGNPEDVHARLVPIVGDLGYESIVVNRAGGWIGYTLRSWVFVRTPLDLRVQVEEDDARVRVTIAPVPGQSDWERGPVFDWGVLDWRARRIFRELARREAREGDGDQGAVAGGV
jgi:hypothetical protein